MAEKTQKEELNTCQSCGADVREDVCMGCMMNIERCTCEKDVTSSVYPQ